MTAPKRLTREQAATLLGVAPATVTKYARDGVTNSHGAPFPAPANGVLGAGGEWLQSALKGWQKARIGQGGPGVRKNREGTACDRCGNVVERRKKDPATGDYLCKLCDLKAGEAELPQP